MSAAHRVPRWPQIDFGYAALEEAANQQLSDLAGSPEYAASPSPNLTPEVLTLTHTLTLTLTQVRGARGAVVARS